MTTGQLISLAAAGVVLGCGGAGTEARDVANRFWEASREGDVELVRTLVASGGEAKINEPDDDSTPFGDYSLGEVTVEDGVAAVATTLEGMQGAESREVAFNTYLVREAGDWKVDLDRTTNDMMRVMLGVTMEQLGEMMGEAVGKAMGGMAEGLQEGMEAMGDALGEAVEKANKENEKR